MTIVNTQAIKSNIAIVIILTIKTNKAIKTNICLFKIKLDIKFKKVILRGIF